VVLRSGREVASRCDSETISGRGHEIDEWLKGRDGEMESFVRNMAPRAVA